MPAFDKTIPVKPPIVNNNKNPNANKLGVFTTNKP